MRLEARAAMAAWRGVQMAALAVGVPEKHRATAELYLLVTACNVTGALAAEVAGCSKQNVSKALRAVELRRDDPGLDLLLGRLEAHLMGEA